MRTTEAKRYARWSVTVAVMLMVMAASVYVWRSWETRKAQTAVPPSVPPAVQQRSAQFTFSRVVGNDTRFILRASRATEFKEGGRTLLEDVWITAFGGNGKRSDELHTPSCEYLVPSGAVTCPGEVWIDLQEKSSGVPESGLGDPAATVHIVTSHLRFERDTGVASSNDPVHFRFPEGEGQAIGLTYDSDRGELRLLRDVEIVFRTRDGGRSLPPTANDPMTVKSGELRYRRDERLIHLTGAARLHQGIQELQAGQMTLELDSESRARRLVARDHPVLIYPDEDADISLAGDELVIPLGQDGRPAQVLASGNVVLRTSGAGGRHQLTAVSSTLDLVTETQQPRRFTATGDVVVRSTLPDGSPRRLQTSHLEIDFVTEQDDSRIDVATAVAATMEWETAQRSAGPGAEVMRLKGDTLVGSFGQDGELRELRGTGAVEVQKRSPGEPPLTSTSRQLLARMAPGGQWSTVDQSGEVRLKDAGGEAQGDHAEFNRATDSVTLTGSVLLADASSQTRTQAATFHRTDGRLRAEGGVSTTERANARGAVGDAQSESTHISSARMVADTGGGHAVYSGRARMWQGDSVIQADTIELDRPGRGLIATGNVNAIFPQARAATAAGPLAGRGASTGPLPSRFWRTEAGRLIYEEEGRRVRLENGAKAQSPDGSMRADRMVLFFTASPGSPAGKAAAGLGASLASQELQRVQGVGAVRVESAGRIGTSEQADYSSAESKFILSGGRPTLIDQFGNSTAGRQLTFFFSDDRIVVDSEEGSRTLTLHRVEK